MPHDIPHSFYVCKGDRCPSSEQIAIAAIIAAVDAERERAIPHIPTPRMIAAAWDAIDRAKNAAGIRKLGPGAGPVDIYRAMVAAIRNPETR
jgi:hypothetical protein